MADVSLPRPVLLAGSWLLGSVPFTQLAAGRVGGVDLRTHGSGTVSGSGLYEVAGFRSLVMVGWMEVAKGAAGPLACRRRGHGLGALAASAAICGHNWSPFLHWSGGRGLSPALGAGLVLAPEATVTLGLGMALGRLARQTGLGSGLALLALPAVLGRTRGLDGVRLGVALALPVMVKRLTANGRRADPRRSGYLSRLLLDRDGGA